jgi:hypothetical protein
MNDIILVGFDLVVSAALIFLAMYVVWSRVQSRLESFGGKESAAAAKPPAPDWSKAATPSAEDAPGDWAFGGITEKAANLKQKGCTMEQIAQRLQLPTREVEMVLAISEMAKTDKQDRGVHVPFSLEPEAVRLV